MSTSISRSRADGFTLVELMVAAALMAIVMIGVLNMLDTSTNLSKVEAALADTQENVRFAAYHVMRTARMAGGGEMPFARTAGGNYWIVGQVLDDQTGTVTIPDIATVQVAPGSDVLVLRGFFETSTFFTNRSDVNAAASTVTIREHRISGVASSDVINPLDGVPQTGMIGRGIVFMGVDEGVNVYQVGEIIGWSMPSSPPTREIEITYGDGSGKVWPKLNRDGTPLTAATDPTFSVYRVGVLQSYAYWVRPDFTLMRMRATSAGPIPEPVAVNIGSLQVLLGIDTTNDGAPDVFNPDPTVAEVTAGRVTSMRITVLGRTPFNVRDWTEPAETFAIAGDNPVLTLFNRSAKWRRMDVTAGLRNFSL